MLLFWWQVFWVSLYILGPSVPHSPQLSPSFAHCKSFKICKNKANTAILRCGIQNYAIFKTKQQTPKPSGVLWTPPWDSWRSETILLDLGALSRISIGQDAPGKSGELFVSFLEMRKMTLRDVEWFVTCYRVSERWKPSKRRPVSRVKTHLHLNPFLKCYYKKRWMSDLHMLQLTCQPTSPPPSAPSFWNNRLGTIIVTSVRNARGLVDIKHEHSDAHTASHESQI